MIIEPKVLNNICITAHPLGCEKEVQKQIDYIKKQKKLDNIKNALIIGCSGGYGLASRIALAFSANTATIGVSLEKEAQGKRTATPGWYNNEAFSKIAKKEGVSEKTFNLDAFLNESKETVINEAKNFFDGKIDVVIYSLASPVRMDEKDGILYRSTLKPLGSPFLGMGVDFLSEKITEVKVDPANEEELKSTIKVMGGEDWKLWTEALINADLLSENAINIAYSYIGPEITKGVYRDGTIGKAKDHLDDTADELDEIMTKSNMGHAYISVNKAVVTRASSVIPTIPLYVGILFKVMQEKGLHEGCIEQSYRLFNEKLSSRNNAIVDENRKIRLDDWEMRADVQKEVIDLWSKINQDNLTEIADLKLFRKDYMNLHGFEIEGIDYAKDVNP